MWHLPQKSILVHVFNAKKTHSMQKRLLYSQALKEVERAELQGYGSHHYLCVHTGKLLLQSAAAVSNVVVPLQRLTNGSISSPSFVPHRETLITSIRTAGVTCTRQRQTAATPGQRSSIS